MAVAEPGPRSVMVYGPTPQALTETNDETTTAEIIVNRLIFPLLN